MKAGSARSWLSNGSRWAAGLMAAFFLGIAPVWAGVGGSAVPDFPDVVNVGDTFAGTLTLTNNSNGTNLTESVTATGIFLTPSCIAGIGICSTPDPGVFAIGATGTGSLACAGQTFNIVETNPATGEVEFTPTSGAPSDARTVARWRMPIGFAGLTRKVWL